MDMCIAIEEIKKEAAQEAEAKGEAKSLLASIKAVMETLNLAPEQAMRVLKIPEDKRETYAKLLQG